MEDKTLSGRIKVLLAEDGLAARTSLGQAIDHEPELMLVGKCEYEKGYAVQVQTLLRPDVMLVDVSSWDDAALQLLRDCVMRWPDCAILVLSASNDESDIFACIRAGTDGYLHKDATSFADIVDALHSLHAGGSPISLGIARKLLQALRDKSASRFDREAADDTHLTPRELTILNLIAAGNTYNEVSRILAIAIGTVQNHIKSIYIKLSVNSRGQAVFEAHRRGLIMSQVQFGDEKNPVLSFREVHKNIGSSRRPFFG